MTLVEMLVGLALLGMIGALGAQHLHGGVRLWHAADARAAAMQRTEVAHAALRRLLEEATPLAEPDGSAAFAGEATRLRWVGRAPAAAMPPGLHVLELALADGRLTLGWTAHDPSQALAAHSVAGTLVVLDGIAAGSLGFFGTTAAGGTSWHPRWQGQPGPPRLVRIDLLPAAAARWRWPLLVIAPGATIDGA